MTDTGYRRESTDGRDAPIGQCIFTGPEDLPAGPLRIIIESGIIREVHLRGEGKRNA
jgi:hypothetical protein